MDKILSFLEKRPRELVLAVLLFSGGVTTVSGLCFYVLSQQLDNERTIMRAELTLAKNHFEDQLNLIKERAKLSSQDYERLANALVPGLKAQAEDLTKIKEAIEHGKLPEKSAAELGWKIDALIMRSNNLAQRLDEARVVGFTPVTTAVQAEMIENILLPRLARWALIIGGGFFLLAIAVIASGALRGRAKGGAAA